ncbi:hypothetical protein [Streptomyces wuyuanensis]|uniref:Uncharacterized protein n=1 Tax=Streptomyces wuyuanensis TaxID=1196353 RepID=A0A1G9TUJ0_9ACTN|nr:hypothetical protein [Streptomyces wuyuanensis]SDM51248.1 hypothetical protein SAMN05444921_109114 [Streptomyces wuyuanensis]
MEHRARSIGEGMDQAAGVAAALGGEPLADLYDELLTHREVPSTTMSPCSPPA